MAARSRLTSRRTWAPGRKRRPRARNTRSTRRLATAACDICPVVLCRSGGPRISGGDKTGRSCHLGRVSLVFAPPETTSRPEKTPRKAEISDERARKLARLGYLFSEINRPGGKTRTCAKESNQVPFWESRLRRAPSASFHPVATQTNAGEILERRCCLSGITLVIPPPASTSRAADRNVGEEIERSATSLGAPPTSPGRRGQPTPAHQARKVATTAVSPLLVSWRRWQRAKKEPVADQKSAQAPVWRSRPGKFSGGSDHVRGENTNNGR